uniref:Uncharacterized protein n=1 Tax=Hemiselmis andersenii TaxID=464988 RepID=A0A6U5CN74_HEMAN|mmetsp:Transcript_20517/g.47389  ORF Transcript_20517/g.47389 Transcript_20517/m.47389 type:complete len:810 (+) Transcript_20517:99-2528(+)
MATSMSSLITATRSFHRPPGANSRGELRKIGGSFIQKASPALKPGDKPAPPTAGAGSFGRKSSAPFPIAETMTSLSDLPEVDTMERDPANRSPDDEELMQACQEGDHRHVKSVLFRGNVHINMVDEDGLTPLIKAVRYGHPKIVHILLQAGADTTVVDKFYRTAWYFACFSSAAPVGRHWRCMLELCSAVFEEDLTPEIILTACYSNQSRVLNVLLEHFKRTIPSRDSKNWCKFEFWDLNKLDDFEVQMTWPDGSKSPAGQTALYALIDKEKKRALVHPTIRGLLLWKWNKYGRYIFYLELFMHTLSVACLSGSAATLRFGELETRDLNSRVPNLLLQGVSLMVGVLFFVRDMFDMNNRHKRKQKARFMRHVGSLLAFVLNLAVMILYVMDSAEVQGRVTAAANGTAAAGAETLVSETRKWLFRVFGLTIVWIWMRFFNYLELVDWIGSFFIMVERIIREDLTRWAIVILVTMPGFSLAFNLIFDIVLYEYEVDPLSSDAVLAETAHLRNTYIGWHNAIFGQFLVMFSLDSWPRGQNEPISAILLVGFVVMLNLISVNLLIAMMASTYEAVKDDALPEWNFRQARFIMERSYLFSRDFVRYKEDYNPYKFEGFYYHIFPNLKEDHEHGDIADAADGREHVTMETFEEAQGATMAKMESLRALMYQVQENQDTLRSLISTMINPGFDSKAASPKGSVVTDKGSTGASLARKKLTAALSSDSMASNGSFSKPPVTPERTLSGSASVEKAEDKDEALEMFMTDIVNDGETPDQDSAGSTAVGGNAEGSGDSGILEINPGFALPGQPDGKGDP